MTVADSPKKRKRVASPHDKGTRIPIRKEESKSIDMASNPEDVRSYFDGKLGDAQEIKAYTELYEQLLQSEAEDAWDRESKPRANSRSKDDQTEIRAAHMIHSIREYERRKIFGNLASEAIPDPKTTRDMGGQFLTNKAWIESRSILYQIAKAVPKGCLLHLHFNAELHPELLLEQAREIKDMYIRSIIPLTSREALDKTEMVFNVLDSSQVEPNVNIFSEDYKGTATNWRQDEFKWKIWMKWSDFQEEFFSRFGEEFAQKQTPHEKEPRHACTEPGNNVTLNPAENWLKKKMVLSEEEAYAPTQTVNG
jgi:adenosine deaminase CECR1